MSNIERDKGVAFDFEDLGRAVVGGTKSYRLTSKAIGQDFQVDICRPAIPCPAGQLLPVAYVLDGNGAFGVTAQTAQMLQLGGELPPLWVVGVGYRFSRGQDPRFEHGRLRGRDFSPVLDAEALERTRAAFAGYPGELRHGGADAFLAFLEDELKPFIATRCGADPADQTLVGMSLGGLFALHALFTRPQAFNRVVALSPAMWWGDKAIFAAEAALAARASDLPVRLFLGVGELEEADGALFSPVSNLAAMAQSLGGRGYRGLDMTHHVFPGETHMSVYPGAVSRGLRAVFSAR
jgi:predicted alpha/beta superfamily hydrolase